jgi:hypothetical protein
LKAFACYRWLKSLKVQNDLKKHSIELLTGL